MKTISEEDQVPVIVYFNPWNFSSIDQLITMFFRELWRTLEQKDKGAIAGKIGVAPETLYVSNRLQLPLDGILLIGY